MNIEKFRHFAQQLLLLLFVYQLMFRYGCFYCIFPMLHMKKCCNPISYNFDALQGFTVQISNKSKSFSVSNSKKVMKTNQVTRLKNKKNN